MSHRIERRVFPGGRQYVLDGETKLEGSTSFVARIFPGFDADKVLTTMYRGGKYKGKSDEEIKEGWKRIGEEAAALGTRMHERIERYYVYGSDEWSDEAPVLEGEDLADERESFFAFEEYRKERGWEFHKAEWVVFDERMKIGGMIDAVFRTPEGEYVVVDWKRCKDVTVAGSPVGFRGLKDCKLDRFRVQISLYAQILRDNYGLKVHPRGYVVNIHPNLSSIYAFDLLADF